MEDRAARGQAADRYLLSEGSADARGWIPGAETEAARRAAGKRKEHQTAARGDEVGRKK